VDYALTGCSDRVIVLDAGQIAEFASPRELLEQPRSIFAGMCKAAGITGLAPSASSAALGRDSDA
jgi:ABC-type proline/glycine betaine transport system ATPase subunit